MIGKYYHFGRVCVRGRERQRERQRERKGGRKKRVWERDITHAYADRKSLEL